MKILVVGGGSGGHITPAVAVVRELLEKSPKTKIEFWTDRKYYKNVVKITTEIGMSWGSADEVGTKKRPYIRVRKVAAGKFHRYAGWKLKDWFINWQIVLKELLVGNVAGFLGFIGGLHQSFWRMFRKKNRPDVIFLKGGFVGLPVGMVARKLKIPYVIHESDATPGLANRLLMKDATVVACGWNDALEPQAASKALKERPEVKSMQSSISSVASFSSLRTLDAPSGLHSGSLRTPSASSASSNSPRTSASSLEPSSNRTEAPGTAGDTTKVFEKLKDTTDVSNGCNTDASGCFSKSLGVSQDRPLCIFTGIPVASEFDVVGEGQQKALKKSFGFNVDRPLVVVTGGSQGSENINTAMKAILPEMLKFASVGLVAGRKHYENMVELKKYEDWDKAKLQSNFRMWEFNSAMHELLGAADVVVSRAGATTIAELAALEKAVVLVPYEKLPGGHQFKNAKDLERRGAAVVVEDPKMQQSPSVLLEAVRHLVRAPRERGDLAKKLHQEAAPDAAERLAGILLQVAKNGEVKISEAEN